MNVGSVSTPWGCDLPCWGTWLPAPGSGGLSSVQCANLGWACPHTQAGPDSLSLPRIPPGLALLAQSLADLLQQTPPSQVAAAPGPLPGRAAGPGEESDPPAILPACLPQPPGLPPGCLEGHLVHSVRRLGWGQRCPRPISLPGV